MAIQFKRCTVVDYSKINALSAGQPLYDMTNNKLYMGGYTTYGSTDALCSVTRGGIKWQAAVRFGAYSGNDTSIGSTIYTQYYTSIVNETASLSSVASNMYYYGGYYYTWNVWAHATGWYNSSISSTYNLFEGNKLVFAVSPNSTSTMVYVYVDFTKTADGGDDYYGSATGAIQGGADKVTLLSAIKIAD